MLTCLIAIVQSLAVQNLALRGHTETLFTQSIGNFLKEIELMARFDPIMKDHLKPSSHYRILSPICKLTSSPTGRALIGGKSAGDRRSAIFVCKLHNDASKRLNDASLTPRRRQTNI